MGIRNAAALTSVLLLVTGCFNGEEPDPSASKPTEISPSVSNNLPESGQNVTRLGGSTLAFGELAEYEDGVSVKLSKPQQFTPSRKAITGSEETYVKFTVQLINDSERKVSPGDISLMVESQGGQAGDVVDRRHGITGPPQKAVRPGARASWVQGFGVLDPNDIAVIMQAGIGQVPVEYVN